MAAAASVRSARGAGDLNGAVLWILELPKYWFRPQKCETPVSALGENGRLLDGGVYWKQFELFASPRSPRFAFK